MLPRVTYLQRAGRIRTKLAISPRRPAGAVMLSLSSPSSLWRSSQTMTRGSLSQDYVSPMIPDVPSEAASNLLTGQPSSRIVAVTPSPMGEYVTVQFTDATFTFHSQWLHDAQTDDGAYRQAAKTYTHKTSFAEIQTARSSGHGIENTLEIFWKDGRSTRFPSVWLRVYAPLVAKYHENEPASKGLRIPKGWRVDTLEMPEISYNEIFPEIQDTTALRICETLLDNSSPGILRVTNLPSAIAEDERKGENTLLAKVLMQSFGSVFSHPRRGPEVAYTMASHHEQYANKGKLIPNYNLTSVLLPHFDQSMYQHPSLIDGLYNIEGESLNTFVSCPAVLQTLQDESPELVEPLFTTPVAFGRVAHIYSPPQYQGTTPTTVIPRPGFPNQIYRFHWNPHQVGALLCPFHAFPTALRAHRKFQEISSRDTHQLKVKFKPGDMYLWDNHKVLHGRDKVLKTPRTAVGQTSPEQAVVDRWREILIRRLLGVLEERWLVQVPLQQLRELDKMVDALGARPMP